MFCVLYATLLCVLSSEANLVVAADGAKGAPALADEDGDEDGDEGGAEEGEEPDKGDAEEGVAGDKEKALPVDEDSN